MLKSEYLEISITYLYTSRNEITLKPKSILSSFVLMYLVRGDICYPRFRRQIKYSCTEDRDVKNYISIV